MLGKIVRFAGMKETELWELLVSLSANDISLKEAHDRILRLVNDVERSEQGQLRIGAVMCWVVYQH